MISLKMRRGSEIQVETSVKNIGKKFTNENSF